jgi:hypothetical protein
LVHLHDGVKKLGYHCRGKKFSCIGFDEAFNNFCAYSSGAKTTVIRSTKSMGITGVIHAMCIQEAVAEDLVILVHKPDSAMEGLGWGKFFPIGYGGILWAVPVFHIIIMACLGFMSDGSRVMIRGARSWTWCSRSAVSTTSLPIKDTSMNWLPTVGWARKISRWSSFEMGSEIRELPHTLAFDQMMPECLKNMSSSLVAQKLDVVGAASSSSGAKYSL